MNTLRVAVRSNKSPISRSFVTSTRNLAAHRHGDDPELIDKEKQKNLSKTQDETSAPFQTNAPGWNEYLASDAEANIKADQSPSVTPADLAKSTVERVTKRYKESTTTATTDSEHDYRQVAQYTREEVEGPLGHKGGTAKIERKEVKETITGNGA